MVKKILPAYVLLAGLLVFSAAAGISLGSVYIKPAEILRILFSSVPAEDSGLLIIVRDIRIVRVLLAAVTGAGLGAAGAALQGLFRNPLADPYIIGTSAGAAFGAAAGIIFNIKAGFLGMTAVPFMAFAGAITAVLLVYAVTAAVGNAPAAVTLLLAGTAVSALFSSAVTIAMSLWQKDMHQIFFWLMGSLHGRGWKEFFSVFPFVFTGFIVLLAASRPLDLLGFGEETASGLGLAVKQSRLIIISAAALITAAAVAAAGIIGFVGLVAPHLGRMLFGPSHKNLIFASALLGGIMVINADLAARLIISPSELPLGSVTALIGAPFFLYLLKKNSDSGSGL